MSLQEFVDRLGAHDWRVLEYGVEYESDTVVIQTFTVKRSMSNVRRE